jgi:hypothetical protein
MFNEADICLGYVVLNGNYELLMRRIWEKMSAIYVRVIPQYSTTKISQERFRAFESIL